MSKENVQGFYDSIGENKELNKALLEAVAAGNVVAFAKKKGFEFTQAEYDEFMAVIVESMSKLSDDQLEEVAGGWPSIPDWVSNPETKVSCKQCTWDSGWISDLKWKDVLVAITAHKQEKGHDGFNYEHRT